MPIKKSQSKNFISRFFIGTSLVFSGMSGYAQCAMCRASLESSGEVSQAEAVNDGIVYLMAIPYILVAALGFVIYKMYRKKKQ
ncbi:hypothetical protein [Flavobacterium luminosum]|uniref:Adenylosuccinate synthetase n=1 Tax=Flavobacterium luminosum TaxID=2949086 RepID=A0ABT0TKS4_9FLAO|nr:hypothetical protein [Flavobacterium sp. HXWNR70]MCL9808097.1 hypothetical protein [Flavobacterium sp. HXWNR70]